MSLIVEFDVDSPLMQQASRAAPEMRIRGEDKFIQEDGDAKYLFWAAGGSFEAFEAGLDEDPSIRDFVLITSIDGSRFYRVTFPEAYVALSSYTVALERDILFVNTTLQDGTYRVQMRVPSREAFREYRRFYEDHDIPLRLITIYHEDPTSDPDRCVTDCQREALVLAYESGYYDSPRETTLDDIATHLDISRQALAERLKRGTKRLIGEVLR